MADTQDRTVKKAWKAWRARKVITIGELTTLLECSLPTARRRLKAWNTLTSYNKNGRYYVLPDVPQFDACGLWHFHDTSFSEHGNLTQTLIELVRRSQAGLSASELGALLQLDPRSFLWQFRNHPALKRERQVGRFVYYAAEPEIFRQQKVGRAAVDASARLPSDTQAVAILVEAVKYPQFSIDRLCAHLKRQRVAVSAQDVSNLFTHHGLAVKKRAVLLRNLSFLLPEPTPGHVVLCLPVSAAAQDHLLLRPGSLSSLSAPAQGIQNQVP